MIRTTWATSLVALLGAVHGAPALAGCPEPIPISELEARLDRADSAYSELDVGTFTDELDAAGLEMPCLGEVVSAETAARYHVLVGLRLFGDGLEDDARRAFMAARVADASAGLPEAVPMGHQARALFSSAETLGVRTSVPTPLQVELWFDGAVRRDRPEDHPSLVQVVDAEGVLATRYVLPDDALPPYPLAPPRAVVGSDPAAVPPSPSTLPAPASERRGISPARWTLLGVGAASAAGGIGLYLAAQQAERDFWAPLGEGEGVDSVYASRRRANTLSGVSVALGGVALLSGVGVVLVR